MPMELVAIGRAVMYYVRAAHELSAGSKCWHCSAYLLFLVVTLFSKTIGIDELLPLHSLAG